jgi:protein disulfide-isomerase A6
MKGAVKVAYWDTAQGNPPPLIGQIKGTPTIKFIAPHKKNKRTTNKRKSISDYNGERKLDAMLGFSSAQQPNYATSINGNADLKKFEDQAEKYALPKAIVITKESSTSRITKFLSTEFRRKVLIGNVRASKPNKAVIEKFGLDEWLADKNAEKTVIGWLRGDGDFPMMKKKGKVRLFLL